MRTLNYVVLVLVLVSFGFVSFGCGDDSSSPVSPSVMQEAPSVRATAPSTPVRGATPASFDADNVRPDQDPNRPGIDAGKNAYNFRVEYVNGKLQLSLIRGGYEGVDWRPASLPHRRRLFSFYLCPTEPHHVGQTCYDIAKKRLRFCEDPRGTGACKAKRVITLEPMPMLGYCDPDSDWIVVTAAELSDDKYNGWRNAPCPRQNGVTTSDGVGHGWPTTLRSLSQTGTGSGTYSDAGTGTYSDAGTDAGTGTYSDAGTDAGERTTDDTASGCRRTVPAS